MENDYLLDSNMEAISPRSSPNNQSPNSFSRDLIGRLGITSQGSETVIYETYYISIEQTLLCECRDLPTAVLLALASYYIFNLAYTAKATNFYRFIQEKLLGIPTGDKMKSPVAVTHFNGITRKYT